MARRRKISWFGKDWPIGHDDLAPYYDDLEGFLGVHGARDGIAAQFANAGVPVLLLDIVPPGATDRNALAQAQVVERAEAIRLPSLQPAAGAAERGAVQHEQRAEIEVVADAVLVTVGGGQLVVAALAAVFGRKVLPR